ALKLVGVGHKAPHARKLLSSQRERLIWMLPRPIDRSGSHSPVKSIFKQALLVRIRQRIRGPLLGHKRTNELHIARAAGRGAEAVVKARADLQRRGHEAARDAVIANPPRNQRDAK